MIQIKIRDFMVAIALCTITCLSLICVSQRMLIVSLNKSIVLRDSIIHELIYKPLNTKQN